jgi:hypothetical protein
VEAAVFPREQVGEAAGADVFAVAEGNPLIMRRL